VIIIIIIIIIIVVVVIIKIPIMWVMLYQWAYLQACDSICVMSVASVFFFFQIFRVKFKICALA